MYINIRSLQFLKIAVSLLFRGSSIEGKYEQIMAEFRKAIEHGVADKCPPQYTCKKESINNFLKEEGK